MRIVILLTLATLVTWTGATLGKSDRKKSEKGKKKKESQKSVEWIGEVDRFSGPGDKSVLDKGLVEVEVTVSDLVQHANAYYKVK